MTAMPGSGVSRSIPLRMSRVGAGAPLTPGGMVFAAVVASATALMAGCAGTSPPAAPGARPTLRAFALLEPTKGNVANGSVRLAQEGDGVVVIASVSNLAPGSAHGFHVHENGDCGSGDGMSAGGHFSPDVRPHGPQNAAHHAGDMPALIANANGVAEATFVLHGVSVSAGPHSIVGKSLIVHNDADDYTTQPTGNSGARIACGVVVPR